MMVAIFGATGMVGQGALRECLLDDRTTSVLVVGRTSTGQSHPKLREIVHADLANLTPIAAHLSQLDACFYCLGLSSAGVTEAAYRRITYDMTIAAAWVLLEQNPALTFNYISGQGTNTTGRAMWARVKGQTEDALLAMSPRAYMFRPGIIQPRYGVRSKTRLYSTVYTATRPLFPILRTFFPGSVTTTQRLGRALIAVASNGAPKRILETRDINQIGARQG